MSTLPEREKNKALQDKCQSILSELLKDEDNKYCVDCDAKSPRWASWNLGIFLCIRCAGIHRNLGVHISKVKSVNLDTWTPQQVACIQQMGNSRARAVYEANVPDNFRRPQSDSALEQFVRSKYEQKKYIAKEWVPPPMPNPAWDVELEKQAKARKKEKRAVVGTVELPAPVLGTKSGGLSPKPLPKAPGSKNSSPLPSVKVNMNITAPVFSKSPSSNQDLLGLATNGTNLDSSDPFGEFLSASSINPTLSSDSLSTSTQSVELVKTDEENFFNQKLSEGGLEKLTKDSIMALYGKMPAQPQPQQLFGVSGGVYMGTGQVGVAPGGVTGVPGGMIGSLGQPNVGGMFMSQPGLPAGGMPNSFFVNGVPQGVAASIQLSAANPFAQMQSQMGTLNMGGIANNMAGPPVGPPGQMMMGSLVGLPGQPVMGILPPSMGAVSGTSHPMGALGGGMNSNTLATNLWQ